jgi:hypothetical protein
VYNFFISFPYGSSWWEAEAFIFHTELLEDVRVRLFVSDFSILVWSSSL